MSSKSHSTKIMTWVYWCLFMIAQRSAAQHCILPSVYFAEHTNEQIVDIYAEYIAEYIAENIAEYFGEYIAEYIIE